MIKVKLRTKPADETVIIDNLIDYINSFELGFRFGGENKPYLKARYDRDVWVTETIYIQNVIENQKYFLHVGLIDTRTKTRTRRNTNTNTNDYEWFSSTYDANRIMENPNIDQWVGVNIELHKDYNPMLIARIAHQEKQKQERREHERLEAIETMRQIESLKALAAEHGLTSALDYISDYDPEND